MAQKVFWSFKDDDSTEDLVRWLLGILEPGRYRGYDFVPQPNLTFRMEHTTTGINQVRNGLQEVRTGVAVSPQGSIIQDDDIIELPINATVSNPRIDLIVLSHEYEQVAGGSPATYSVVQGSEAAVPTAPSVANPLTDIVLGELYLPTGLTQLDQAGVVFTPVGVPNLGNRDEVSITSPSGNLVVTTNGAVVQIDYAEGSVSTINLENGAVTTVKLGDGSVTKIKLADLSVSTGKLVNAAVTLAKMAANSVGENQIVDEAVTSAKIQALAITAAKIALGAVGTDQLAGDSVTNAKLGPDVKVGSLATLNTNAQSSVVAAMNELLEKFTGYGEGLYNTVTLDIDPILSGTLPTSAASPQDDAQVFGLTISNRDQRIFKLSDGFSGTRPTNAWLLLANIKNNVVLPTGHKIWVVVDIYDLASGFYKIGIGLNGVPKDTTNATLQAFFTNQGKFNITNGEHRTLAPAVSTIEAATTTNSGTPIDYMVIRDNFVNRNVPVPIAYIAELEYSNILSEKLPSGLLGAIANSNQSQYFWKLNWVKALLDEAAA